MSARELAAAALLLACATLAAGAGYCGRADVAWRALRAPLALDARVLSVSEAGRAATLQVRRVLRRPPALRWPRRDAVLRLQLDARPRDCTGRFEVPLRNGNNYIVFAERRGHTALALGPPLRRTRKLLRRIRAVYAPDYIRPARVQPMRPVVAAVGGRVRLECRASGRPPPRITWYKDGKPVEQIALRRLRVQTFRRRSVLAIRHAQLADSAQYSCHAQGAAGAADLTSANVTVLAPTTPSPSPDTAISGSPCPMPDPSSFCMNGGTCIYFQQVGESACKCLEGFIGHRCENKEVSNKSINDESNDWD